MALKREFIGKVPTRAQYPNGTKVRKKHKAQKASMIFNLLGVDLE